MEGNPLSRQQSDKEALYAALSHLKSKEKELLRFLLKNHLYEFTPILSYH